MATRKSALDSFRELLKNLSSSVEDRVFIVYDTPQAETIPIYPTIHIIDDDTSFSPGTVGGPSRITLQPQVRIFLALENSPHEPQVSPWVTKLIEIYESERTFNGPILQSSTHDRKGIIWTMQSLQIFKNPGEKLCEIVFSNQITFLGSVSNT